LKDIQPEIAKLITDIINLCLKDAYVPLDMKIAIATPLLKKASLDPNVLNTY
jgi:hypothetical protein